MGLLSGVGGVGGVVECWGVGWMGFLSGVGGIVE